MNELALRYLYNLTAGRVWLEQLVTLAGVYLGWAIVVLVLIIYFYRARERLAAGPELIFVASTASAAWFIAHLIKWLWPSTRPLAALPDITPLFAPGGANAFPSGHAAFFFALALAVYLVDRKFGQWLIIGATIISLARVMAGVHWPLDVLGGLALAIFTTAAALFLTRLINPGFGHER